MNYKRKDTTEIVFTSILEDKEQASIFHHFKNKDYKIITLAKHSEDDETYVVYQAMYGDNQCYIRPAEMFFSKVDKEKYPDIEQEYRFQLENRNEVELCKR